MISRYIVTMQHDAGRVRLKVCASSAVSAARVACEAERAPLRSVVRVVPARGGGK